MEEKRSGLEREIEEKENIEEFLRDVSVSISYIVFHTCLITKKISDFIKS